VSAAHLTPAIRVLLGPTTVETVDSDSDFNFYLNLHTDKNKKALARVIRSSARRVYDRSLVINPTIYDNDITKLPKFNIFFLCPSGGMSRTLSSSTS